jgi:hypothetical protein
VAVESTLDVAGFMVLRVCEGSEVKEEEKRVELDRVLFAPRSQRTDLL